MDKIKITALLLKRRFGYLYRYVERQERLLMRRASRAWRSVGTAATFAKTAKIKQKPLITLMVSWNL